MDSLWSSQLKWQHRLRRKVTQRQSKFPSLMVWKEPALDQQWSTLSFLLIATRNLSRQDKGRRCKSEHCKLKPTIFCTSVDTPVLVSFRHGVKYFFGATLTPICQFKAIPQGTPDSVLQQTEEVVVFPHHCAYSDTAASQLCQSRQYLVNSWKMKQRRSRQLLSQYNQAAHSK